MYVYNKLLSLNEVGGSPEKFGSTVEDFHRFNAVRSQRWPRTMNATSTHDTKRGEDVRARISVLSELPGEWEQRLAQWTALNKKKKTLLRNRSEGPDRNDEYFLYQTLVGAYPFEGHEGTDFVERVQAYALKAIKESKVHTGYLRPNEEYENAVRAFISSLFDHNDTGFLDDFLPFQRTVAWYGVWNSLSQSLLKITSPGIPDFFQGCELWNFSLVDPDNRRPVDYTRRAACLEEIRARTNQVLAPYLRELLASPEDGRIKLFTIWEALAARKRFSGLFEAGEYLPLEVRGARAGHVIAFARRLQGSWAVIAAPRLLAGMVAAQVPPVGAEVWGETAVMLPVDAPLKWQNIFTDTVLRSNGCILLREALADFPLGFLVG
jgi:(1->4)-alpha-D-glucan 1-alpha-D-glucosylmutase